jgi:hypothetical protein
LGVYEEEATGKMAILRWFNIILLSIMVITVVLTWFLIVQPLIKTLRRIVDNLSNGAEQVALATGEISASSHSPCAGFIRAGVLFRRDVVVNGRDGIHDKTEFS